MYLYASASVFALASCSLLIPTPEPFQPPSDGVSSDYLAFFQGSLVGWERRAVVQRDKDGRTAWSTLTDSYYQFRRGAGLPPITGERFVVADYDDTWSEVRSTIIVGDGVSSRQIDIRWGDPATIEDSWAPQGEGSRTFDPRFEGTLNEEQAPHQLLQGKPGEVVNVRWVSYENATTLVSTWTYLGELCVALHDGRTVRGKAIRRGTGHTAALALYDYSNQLIYTRYSDGFVLERVARIPMPFTPEPLSIISVLDTNIRIGNADELRSMELEFHIAASRDASSVASLEDSAYQEVTSISDGYALRLKSVPVPEGEQVSPYPLVQVPENLRTYLEPTPQFQSDDPDLRRAADQLAGGETAAAPLVVKLCHFVYERLSPGPTYHADADAKTAFVMERGDCSEAASLLVTLARAAGLPARRVAGLLYLPEDVSSSGAPAAFVMHAWAEVWVGKWVPADATTDTVGCAARYISLFYDATGSEVGDVSLLELVSQRSNSLKIIAYELKGGRQWRQPGTNPHFK